MAESATSLDRPKVHVRVLDAGLYTLIVDGGRTSSRALGVPVGGAADRAAWLLGNALVGNPPETPALEIALTGPTLQTEGDLACVLCGTDFQMSSERHPRGSLKANKTFTLAAGETLNIGAARAGARAYLCIRGGVQAPIILGSRSALEPLAAGATLSCSLATIGRRFLAWPVLHGHDPRTLRVLKGVQADWFHAEALYEQAFTVTPASNRMGLRLQSQPLRPRGSGLPELVSEAVSPGAVQVTRDGQCIILGVDGQTIGGYPKVAHVITADLDLLGQLRPGDHIRFLGVELEEAEEIQRRRQMDLRHWARRLDLTL